MRDFEKEFERHEHFEERPHHHRRHHEGRGPEARAIQDRDDLEGLYMAVARELRHGERMRYGSTQDRIIMILDENGGTMSQKSLQQLLDVKPGSISEILSKMEEKGLIERSRDDDDRRSALITLKSEAIEKEERPSFFAILNEEEKETLRILLTKVLEDKRKDLNE